MSSLNDRLVGIRSRIKHLPSRFELPNYREVIIRKKIKSTLPNGMISSTYVDYLIEPNPKVKHIVIQDVNRMPGKDIPIRTTSTNNTFNYEIKVVRSTPAEELEDVSYIIIDPIFNENNQTIGGIICTLEFINDSNILDWVLIAQREIDLNHEIEPYNSIIRNYE